MTTFAQVRAGLVLAHFTKDITLDEARKAFADIAHELHEAPADAQDGMTFDGSRYAWPVKSADEIRQESIDAAIHQDARIAQLKAMDNAQLSAWWTGLTANARNDFLFLVVRVVLRKVM